MERIGWDTEYSVGIEELDDDHRKIIVLTNLYLDAIEDADDDEKMRKTFKELLSSVRYHFVREEIAMAACSYPKLQSHKMVHAQLIQELLNWDEFFKTLREKGASHYFSEFLISWLFDHILKDDFSYRDALKAQAETVTGILSVDGED